MEVRRAPMFTSEIVSDVTNYGRTTFAKNVVKSVTMSGLTMRTSHASGATVGALDDPKRVARILNTPDPSRDDLNYVYDMIKGQTTSLYYDYLSQFTSQLFKSCNIKSDYDTATGPSGAVVTFANDVPYAAGTQTTDLTDIATDPKIIGLNLVKELAAFVAPMRRYIIGSPIYFLLPRTAFSIYRIILEGYKTSATHRRYEDTSSGGTFLYENADVYSFGDFIFLAMPDENFPVISGTPNEYTALALSPDAIRVIVSQADLTNNVSIFDTTLQSAGLGNMYDVLLAKMTDRPEMVRALSYMGMDPNVSMFADNGRVGSNTLPNLMKIYTNRMGPGTSATSEYPYTRTELNVGILRAIPQKMRQWNIPFNLV